MDGRKGDRAEGIVVGVEEFGVGDFESSVLVGRRFLMGEVIGFMLGH